MESVYMFIINNPELCGSIGVLLIGIVDYIIKRTKNKVDDAIWNKIKTPVINFIKSYLKNKGSEISEINKDLNKDKKEEGK